MAPLRGTFTPKDIGWLGGFVNQKNAYLLF